MTGYMVNFGVYTMAMIGIIVMALVVYKKSMLLGGGKKSALKIDDKISLNARKSLYVVNAGGERFLIAGDMDSTSLIAKLDDNQPQQIQPVANATTPLKEFAVERKPFISHENEPVKFKSFKTEFAQAQKSLDEAFSKSEPIIGEKYLDIKSIRKKPVMKELARKLAEI